MDQKPSIGRVVHYRLTATQAEQVNRRRTDGHSIAERIKSDRWPIGAQAHIGNHASEGDILPMIVTAVWPEEYAGNARLMDHAEGVKYEGSAGVNGQVFLDGNDALWVTSAPQHSTLPGCWFWPPRV